MPQIRDVHLILNSCIIDIVRSIYIFFFLNNLPTAAQLWLKLNEKLPSVTCNCVCLLTKEKCFAAIRNKNDSLQIQNN